MFSLSISAIDKIIFDGEAQSLTLPGAEGELTILKNHIPLITPLSKGKILIKTGKKEDLNFPISGGVLEVSPEKVTVLVNL
ncbi:MAG: ATP synthase F1 subunit epsilon [bacterium]|nr:ATP synthase F1 subunit epsilon [bacterium]